mgnify:CR=1 FL=1
MTKAATPPVAIIMGSQSDWATMRHAAETLDALGIGHDDRIVSAHRTPQRMVEFATGAKAEGFKVINLDVRETMDSAMRLYESQGFQRIGKHPCYAIVDGQVLEGYYYCKVIG